MRAPAGKTARFKDVLKQCGRPELYVAWMDPKRDPQFQEAWRENRILSVKQMPDGKKDFGEVGYVNEPGVAYLVFPKSLDPFAGRKVIGIQYDLLEPSKPLGRPVARGQRPKPPAPPKRFEVTVRVMALVHLTERVEAESMREAEETVMKELQARQVDFSDAKLIRRIVKTKKV